MCEVRTEIKYYNTSRCLVCGYQDKVYRISKEEYQEVTVCPKCNGVFVDMFKLEKYKQSNETVEPLLTITLTDIDAKPIVHYKGKLIDRKLRVAFDWESQSIDKINRTYIHIEHVPADNKRFNTEVIQHNHPIVEDEVELYRL
ncbi:zf-TFIIB domain-containing protein [Bacillus paranthracis]|uniref:zf-TFIIB domain-containing protein n=1 Tax=Bacillus paranthracis TaxID=2026186 RepID=UPI0021CF628E|nr:zf-TFIIB domain-containing protein [Bacillus paranthracis]MCU5202066.1 zf-TFIIB domain-containing protein [Bacillus paranthracis]MED0974032.1 zf-TFIIB domain-containing protein [Bacillus paranthracis]MED1137146.1 zf-TFIIB domain-containing protein [Bacillus paranthracis]HDR7485366.1 zf-TFIIB domain-containing protein [Bacillus pacificus]